MGFVLYHFSTISSPSFIEMRKSVRENVGVFFPHLDVCFYPVFTTSKEEEEEEEKEEEEEELFSPD